MMILSNDEAELPCKPSDGSLFDLGQVGGADSQAWVRYIQAEATCTVCLQR